MGQQSYSPSYSTMQPYAAGNIILNGVSVDKNISNQIMFGCNEMRINIEQFRGNIFATLVGYNFGPGGVYWCICKYVAENIIIHLLIKEVYQHKVIKLKQNIMKN